MIDIYYFSGHRVELGDIVFYHKKDIFYSMYSVCNINNNFVKFQKLRHSADELHIKIPDERCHLVSRKNSSEILLCRSISPENYDKNTNYFYYKDGTILEVGDFVSIDGTVKALVNNILPPNPQKNFSGGILLTVIGEKESRFFPYIINGINLLKRAKNR